MSPSQAHRVDMIREPHDRHRRKRLGHIVGINTRNVGNDKIGRLNSLGRLEAMARQQPLQFCPKEQINPNKQDRCHA